MGKQVVPCVFDIGNGMVRFIFKMYLWKKNWVEYALKWYQKNQWSQMIFFIIYNIFIN